jgi:hypothetical protein
MEVPSRPSDAVMGTVRSSIAADVATLHGTLSDCRERVVARGDSRVAHVKLLNGACSASSGAWTRASGKRARKLSRALVASPVPEGFRWILITTLSKTTPVVRRMDTECIVCISRTNPP